MYLVCTVSTHEEIYQQLVLLDYDEPNKTLRSFVETEARRCNRKCMLLYRYTKNGQLDNQRITSG
jgi:hypothetical protein